MNQNTCKTCKWWRWFPKEHWLPLISDPVQFKCMNEHVASDDPAGIVDGEDYDGVWTGPDFGCVHYEETQEQLPQDHPGYAAQQENIALHKQFYILNGQITGPKLTQHDPVPRSWPD